MKAGEGGFTLIEIVISIAVIGIIFSALFVFYFSSQDVFNFSRDRIDFQRAHRLIFNWISRYTRKAICIDDNPAGNDEVLLEYVQEGNEDGIAFGLDDSGYLYYRKRISGSLSTEKRIVDMPGNNLSFSYSGNILTVNFTLINDGKEYSFANNFFPRYPIVTTP